VGTASVSANEMLGVGDLINRGNSSTDLTATADASSASSQAN